jgi:tetratricopeptide (TPR) repeat protein
LKGLKEFAYQIGSRELEMTAIMAQQGMDSIKEHTWLIDRSLLHYRSGQQSVATKLAHQAIDLAVSPKEKLTSAMNLIQMLAFGDTPAQALEIVRKISKDSAEIFQNDIEAEAYLCHYSSLACHFLELNKQSFEQSRRAAELYGALGRRYDQGISWVNAGDGAWGAGRYLEAEEYFKRAITLAMNCHLPHVEDIAKICLANLRMSQMQLDEAAMLYEEGISLAARIGHDWDVLYGKIYQALALGLFRKDYNDLQALARTADSAGYRYLSDIAQSYRLVLGEGVGEDWKALAESPFPGPRAYALAAGIIQGRNLNSELKQLLKSTEGIKGPYAFINRSLLIYKGSN